MTRRAWYATRSRVMNAADVDVSAYQSAEIDSAIESASMAVDTLCRLGDEQRPAFAPWTGTISFDWPVANNDDAYRLWLNNHRLYTFSALTIDGQDETSSGLGWPEYGPPYSALDINESSDAIFTFSSGRGQRSIGITGVWCACVPYERVNTGWTLTGAITSSVGTVVLAAPVDVGSIVRIGSERMIVTERSWITSSQTGSLTASMADVSLTVSNGAAFLIGEELLIDAERLRVRDIAGNTLIVQRSSSGTPLAAHTTATIYWARSCTVDRGALGTTAATHANGDAVLIYQPPALVEQLTIAYVQMQRGSETSGQSDDRKFSGSSPVSDLEKRVMNAYGRQMRVRSI